MFCNANPRNKKKNKNQRTMVTKGKAMKHKDQENVIKTINIFPTKHALQSFN